MSEATTSEATMKPLTGRHFLLIMLAFFGVIITVNLTLAYFATGSWSGLVVKNSYVASQEFNGRIAKAEAQAARGWSHALILEEERLVFGLKDRNGAPITLSEGTVSIGRPASEVEDRVIVLTPLGDGRYAAVARLNPGQWQAHVAARTTAGEDWTLRYHLNVPAKAEGGAD